MRQRIILVAFMIHFLLSAKLFGQNPNFSYPYNYSKIVFVSRVIDGDTFVISDLPAGAGSQHVRMLGVNCPEIARLNKLAEPFSNEAFVLTKSVIENKTVKLTFDGKAFDIFGRLLAYVWLTNSQGRDSLFIQAELLKNGLARISYYNKQKRYYELFYNLRRTAMRKRLGIWGQ